MQKNSNICAYDLNLEDCVLSTWGEWSPCDPSCINSKWGGPPTFKRRNRHIIQQPLHGGQPCVGMMNQTEECRLCEENEESKEVENGSRQCVHYCPGKNFRLELMRVHFCTLQNTLSEPLILLVSQIYDNKLLLYLHTTFFFFIHCTFQNNWQHALGCFT